MTSDTPKTDLERIAAACPSMKFATMPTPPKVGSGELDAAGALLNEFDSLCHDLLHAFASKDEKQITVLSWKWEKLGKRRHAIVGDLALAAPVDHPEVVGVSAIIEQLRGAKAHLIADGYEEAWFLGNFDDAINALTILPRDALVALQPSDSQALEAGVAVTEAMVERIKQRISVFREMRPEDDETWESWYFAAFDLLSVEVAALSTPAKEPGK